MGRWCTPLDVLADRMELPVAQAGDLVVVFQVGATVAFKQQVGVAGDFPRRAPDEAGGVFVNNGGEGDFHRSRRGNLSCVGQAVASSHGQEPAQGRVRYCLV